MPNISKLTNEKSIIISNFKNYLLIFIKIYCD